MGYPRVLFVRGQGATQPVLYEYGTCSRDRVVRTGQDSVNNLDVFFLGAIGHVPES